MEEFDELNTRPAWVLEVGGFRPASDLLTCHLELRMAAPAGEQGSHPDEKPILFVCQMKVMAMALAAELPNDVARVTFFGVGDGGEQPVEDEGLRPANVPIASGRLERGSCF